MGRAIRIDYRFTLEGKVYSRNQALVGDTIFDSTPVSELRAAAIHDALDIDASDFLNRWGEPWTLSEEDWKKAGFDFEYCEEV